MSDDIKKIPVINETLSPGVTKFFKIFVFIWVVSQLLQDIPKFNGIVSMAALKIAVDIYLIVFFYMDYQTTIKKSRRYAGVLYRKPFIVLAWIAIIVFIMLNEDFPFPYNLAFLVFIFFIPTFIYSVIWFVRKVGL